MTLFHTRIPYGVLVLFAAACLLAPARAAATPQFWFAGVDPVVQNDRHVSEPADYMELFADNAPWQVGESGLSVFKISTQLVLRGSEQQLRTVLDGLRRHHIALAIELGLLAYSDRCGKGTEGYGAPLAVDAVARRLRSVGGVLDYVEMDEPVTWGHSKVGANAKGFQVCHDPVESLVDQTAPKIALLQRYFPNVKFGQTDSVNGRYPDQGESIIRFIDALRAKVGFYPAYLHADVAWDSDWRPMLMELVQKLRSRGIRTGVVFDGNVNAPSDQSWVAEALQRFRMITSDPRTRPDDFVFQTWSPQPTRMLPETDPGAWSYALRSGEAALRR